MHRPVHVRRDDRIKAHFLTCFLALLIYKYLEKKVNRGGKHFTTDEIVDTLRDMNFLSVSVKDTSFYRTAIILNSNCQSKLIYRYEIYRLSLPFNRFNLVVGYYNKIIAIQFSGSFYKGIKLALTCLF